MDSALEALVWERALSRCEYCRMPQHFDILSFHVDHIVAKQHAGATVPGNLALACYTCNLHKGPNLSGRDPSSRKIVRLFNPRRHRWARHFRVSGALILGRSPMGRATVATLGINLEHRIALRELLIREDSPWPEM